MDIIKDKLRVKNNKIFYDFETKENKNKTLTLGVHNKEIDKILKKYKAGLNKIKSKKKIFQSSNIYISVYQQKNYLLNNFKNIKLNNSINEDVFYILNAYLNLMEKSLLIKKTEISNDKDLFNYLNNEKMNIETSRGNRDINVKNSTYLSQEEDEYYPSYYIQLPIEDYKVLKFFIVRHNNEYIYGCTYYNRSLTSYSFFNKEDLLDHIINNIFKLIYYKLPDQTNIADFLDNAEVNKELYKMIKY